MKNVVIEDVLSSVDSNVFESAANAKSLKQTLEKYKPGSLKQILGDDTS